MQILPVWTLFETTLLTAPQEISNGFPASSWRRTLQIALCSVLLRLLQDVDRKNMTGLEPLSGNRPFVRGVGHDSTQHAVSKRSNNAAHVYSYLALLKSTVWLL